MTTKLHHVMLSIRRLPAHNELQPATDLMKMLTGSFGRDVKLQQEVSQPPMSLKLQST